MRSGADFADSFLIPENVEPLTPTGRILNGEIRTRDEQKLA
jgi:hypothetical protein